MSEVTNFNELEINDKTVLGSGYIAKVKLATSKVTGRLYAAKIVFSSD